jgi:hypothetical protein
MAIGRWRFVNPGPKGSDPINQSPNPEVNPLLNPLLEQNLGRWAHVYFTNPPETRDQKVRDLLQELEREATGGAASAGQDPVSDSPRNAPRTPEQRAAPKTGEKVLCPTCHRANRAEQSYCGACGSPLRGSPLGGSPLSAAEPDVSRHRDDGAGAPSMFSLSPLPGDSDMQFLREKAFAGAYADQGSHRWKYVIGALFMLLAGMIFYLERMDRAHPVMGARVAATQPVPAPTPPPESQTASSQPAPPTQPLPVESAPSPEAQPTQPAKPMAPETLDASSGQAPKEKEAVGVGLDRSAATVTLPADSPSGRSMGDGSQELLLAQRYLEGDHAPHNTIVAARWLWKAVGKQNSRAGVLLADLYERGDGVPKSCDQARLLLMAALKKGAPDAAEKLRYLESGHCR